MNIKNILRKLLNLLCIDLTKNLKYDRLTSKILKKYLTTNSNCIDIGCHKGEILDLFCSISKNGKHFGFEPIPMLYENLTKKYINNKNVTLFSCALSDIESVSSFNYVKNAPAYSGIQKRKYNIKNPDIDIINVELKKLDDLIPYNLKIDFIKIDVEGAELKVLKGAKEILKKNQPYIIFECGLGSTDFYNTKPEEVYNFINNDVGLEINTLNSFVKNKKSLNLQEFLELYKTNKEYYFIAYKQQSNNQI